MPQAIRPGSYYTKFLQQLQQAILLQASKTNGTAATAVASPTATLDSIATAASNPNPAQRPAINASILQTIDAQLSQTIAGIDTSLAGVGISVDPSGGLPVNAQPAATSSLLGGMTGLNLQPNALGGRLSTIA